ncbi:unnamed protein product [Penicillium pancosmium]
MSNLQPADIAYLDSQKCLHIPTGKFLETLISHYFLYVHPCLPIINETEFWKTFREWGEGSQAFSLLVFQAMLFVASSKAKENGVQSIRVLRDGFYRRAKFLYDFGLEVSHHELCQTSILLSYYCSRLDPLSNTKWLAVAIQHAWAANAHLYHRFPIQAKQKRTKLKRILWSLIVRDRLIALGMRRPLQIPPSHFDPSSHLPLVLDDLEDEIHASEVYDAHTKIILCKMLTSQCQLAVTLTTLLMTIYPGASLEDLKSDLDVMWRKFNDSKARLRHWEQHHMVQISHTNGDENSSISFYHHLTGLYYESAHLALYHHISFCLSADKSQSSNQQQNLDMPNQEGHPDLMDAITAINKRVKHFVVSGTAGWLPISAVAYTIAPQILLNINLRLVGNSTDRRRQGNLLKFYTELSRLYNLRYDVGYISSWIQQIVGIFESLATHSNFPLHLLPAHKRPTSDPTTRSPIKGFNDLITKHPAVYLDLVSLIDNSMSKGRVVLEAPNSLMLLPSIQDSPLRADLSSQSTLLLSPKCQEPSFIGRPTHLDTPANFAMAPDISEEEPEAECMALQQATHSSGIDSFLAQTSGADQFISPEWDLFSSMLSSANPSNVSTNPSNTRQEEREQGEALLNRTRSPPFDHVWIDLGLFGE